MPSYSEEYHRISYRCQGLGDRAMLEQMLDQKIMPSDAVP